MAAYAQQDAERVFQTLIMAMAFIIGSAVTLAITGPIILDSNPASYIIITMLMGIFFILFTLKDSRPMKKGDYGLIAAIAVFVIYLVIISFSRGLLSFEFLSYRVDALLLPLLLLSIVLAISGLKEIKRFAPVIAYLLFASPIILMPLLMSNGGLSSFSAGIVYSIMKATGAQVVQMGLKIAAPSGQAISIASTCVPIGTFVALIMLLIPVAYLYKGSLERKAAWIAGGVILLFMLNILRMVVIALAWAYWGIGSAVSTFHTFAGAIIFYITIVVMLLIYGKFGLKLDLGTKWAKRLKKAFSTYDIEENYGNIFAAILIAIAVLLLSLPYLGSINVSSVSFNQGPVSNYTYAQLYQGVISRINDSGVGYSYLGSRQGSLYFELGRTSVLNSTYLVVSLYPYPESGYNLLFYENQSQSSSYILKSGITVTSFLARSDNATFMVNYFAAPIVVNGTAYSANFEAFSALTPNSGQYCNPALSSGLQEYLESGIYNLISFHSQLPELCSAEKLALT